MSYSKAELIDILTPALVKSSGSTAKEVRSVLNTYELVGLEKELARQRRTGLIDRSVEDVSKDSDIIRQVEAIRAEVRREYENDPERIRQQQQQALEAAEIYRDYYLTQIFKTWVPGHGFATRNKASEEIIIGWLHPGESLNAEWFRKVIQENPSLADQLQWQSADVLDPQKIKQAAAAQLEQDRKTFSLAARQIQVSDNIANFNLVRQTAGEGFSVYQVQHINGLAPASQREIEQWNAEAAAERQDFLINRATPHQLKAAAREESAAHQQSVQQEQARLQIEAQQQRESTMGFPPLPSDFTRERIRAAAPSELKFWMKRFGNFQINLRLNGRS